MAIKFSQFNLRTESTPTMYLVGYDGNQNIHITVDNLISNIIDGTEDTIAMFGPGGNNVIDSMLSQNAGATILTIGGQLNVDAAATFDTSITVTGNSTLNGNVTLGNASTDLITQTGTLYLNGPVKDTTDTLGDADQILVSDATGELNFQDLLATHVGSAEVVKVPVKNLEGSPLTKGDPVYISGSVGASGILEVRLADASNEAKMPALGLLFQDLGINGGGYVVITGKLRNLTTDPIDGQTPLENDVIYVKANGTTGAALTLTKPTGSNLIQNMGKVGRVSTSNNGTFVVSSILRTNDIPNLTPGKIWVGSTGNTIESSSITFTEATGAVQLNEYGAGTITGTATYNLSVDASGNVIETTAVPANIVETLTAAGGTYISLTDATSATDDVDLGTFDLNAADGVAIANERYLTKSNTWAEIATIPGTYTFDVTADSGVPQTILSGETLDIAGGTYITTSVGGTNTVTISHDLTGRTDTASAQSPGYGGTFTAVDSISTNTQGHLTAVNLKTVTMPSADDTNTTYDLSGVGGVNGTAGVRLAGSDATNDDVLIVGAGTTGVVRAGNTLTVTSNDQYTGTVTGTGTANYVSKWTSSSAQGNSTIYDNGTNVGIGTTNPLAKLQVNASSSDISAQLGLDLFGSFKLGDVANNYTGRGVFYSGSPGSEDLQLLTSTFRISGSSGEGIQRVANGDVYLNTQSGVLATLDASTNNFGIGDTGPNAKLTVFRTDTTLASTLSTAESNAGLSVKSTSTYDAKLTISTGTSGVQQIQGVNNAGTTGRDIVLNPYGGNVGIGTTNPTNELTIESTSPVIDIKSTNTFPSGTIRFLKSDGNEFSGIQAVNNPGTSGLILKYVTPSVSSLSSSLQLQAGNLFLSTANSERMRITSTGNVGIGLTGPQAKLHARKAAGPLSSFNTNTIGIFENNAASYVNIVSGSSSQGELWFSDNSEGIGRVRYNHSDNSLQFWVANAEKLRVGASGQIGVGGANYGTAGNVLTSNGASAAPSWQAAGGGGNEFASGLYIGGTAALNLLDDYEEGTYTPALSFTYAGGDFPGTSVLGRYQKIGNTVFVDGYARIDGFFFSPGSQAITFSHVTLPFIVEKNVSLGYAVGLTNANWDDYDNDYFCRAKDATPTLNFPSAANGNDTTTTITYTSAYSAILNFQIRYRTT